MCHLAPLTRNNFSSGAENGDCLGVFKSFSLIYLYYFSFFFLKKINSIKMITTKFKQIFGIKTGFQQVVEDFYVLPVALLFHQSHYRIIYHDWYQKPSILHRYQNSFCGDTIIKKIFIYIFMLCRRIITEVANMFDICTCHPQIIIKFVRYQALLLFHVEDSHLLCRVGRLNFISCLVVYCNWM